MYNIKSIRIQTTTACNLKCHHCFTEAGKAKQKEITLNDFQPVLEDLKKMKTKTAILTGGEPLLRDKFIYELASSLTDFEIINILYSNMTIFNKKIAQKLQKNGVYIIHTSIDAATANEHDCFRGKKGAFDKTIKSIKLAKKLGFQIWVRTTLTNQNIKQVPKIFDLLLKLKVDSFRVRPVITTGSATENLVISKKQLKEVNLFLLKKKQALENKIEIKFLPFCFEFAVKSSWQKKTMPCFETQGYISSVGDIKPCAYYPVVLGNICNNSLFKAWNSKKANDFRKKTQCKECISCKFYSICYGGCRAAAFGRTGIFSAQDPLCLATP